MIKIIHAHNRKHYPHHIHQMHVLRKETFSDRMKWDVDVLGGWEIDGFDACDPLYVLSVDASDNVRGCLRLLPTTGPNMLADVFPDLLNRGQPKISHPNIWESSRFCVRLGNLRDSRSLKAFNRVTAELIAGMGEVALHSGVDQIVTVYDHLLRRIIGRAGCQETLVGGPNMIGGVKTYAGLFDINKDELEAFKNHWGIEASDIAQALSRELEIAA
ncbi:MAG: acyl-homoserine-lactone synthase [Pseudomonadota bacterium]